MTKPQIVVPDMCRKHQGLLLAQAGYGPNDPWRVVIIAAQISLFQAATSHPSTYERIGGDVTRIGEIGCLACDRPDAFGEIVAAATTRDIGAIKAVGERWIADAKNTAGGAR